MPGPRAQSGNLCTVDRVVWPKDHGWDGGRFLIVGKRVSVLFVYLCQDDDVEFLRSKEF